MRPVAGQQARHARDVDDRAAALRTHQPRRVLHAQKHAAQDDRLAVFVFFQRDFGDRPQRADDGGVVDQTIEPSVLLLDVAQHPLEVGLRAHIQRHVLRAGT